MMRLLVLVALGVVLPGCACGIFTVCQAGEYKRHGVEGQGWCETVPGEACDSRTLCYGSPVSGGCDDGGVCGCLPFIQSEYDPSRGSVQCFNNRDCCSGVCANPDGGPVTFCN